jgi:CBS domain-containing membrane protein
LASLGAGAFILSLGALDPLTRGSVNLPALIPPFGASTVIVFFAPDGPAGRAWNVIAGHLGSALVALLVMFLIPSYPLTMQAALAVAGAGVWMVVSRSTHPPGGATALLATLAGQKLNAASFLIPLLLGCLALVGIRRVLDWGIAWSKRAALAADDGWRQRGRPASVALSEAGRALLSTPPAAPEAQ